MNLRIAGAQALGSGRYLCASEEFFPELSCNNPDKNNPTGGPHVNMARAESGCMGPL